MSSWICDGVPKDGNTYPQAISGGHEPCENYGPDCMVCGLPKESMIAGKTSQPTMQVGKTTMSTPSSSKGKPRWLIPAVVLGGLLLLGAGGWALYQVFNAQTDTPVVSSSPSSPSNSSELVSTTAKNPQLFSQGEKILLESTPDKETGAKAFSVQDWDGAIAAYQSSSAPQANDPEGKIYYNNAKARQAGTPLTIAVVVPLTNDPDSAKEILRGVAKYQEEFNQTSAGQLLEVVIANDLGQVQSADIADDLIGASSVLGVIGHGIDPFSQQAISRYEADGLAVLSPLTTSVSTQGQATLKTIRMDDKSNELLSNYLQSVGKTLVEYASQKQSAPGAVIFYNSDSSYSKQLKDALVKALPTVQGKLVKEVDTATGNFDAASAVDTATQDGANVAFIALSKDKDRLSQAVAIAQANSRAGSPLILLGGNELYTPSILIEGGDAIKELVLAVPWSFQPNDPFAQDAIKSWKGRVSWRTATAYDATKVLGETIQQNPNRSAILQALDQGVALTGSTTNFNIFDEVPLVQAVPGSDGPVGSKYQFDPI